MADSESIRTMAKNKMLYDPIFRAKVSVAVGITKEAITGGGRFTKDDRDIAESAAATAFVLAESPHLLPGLQ